MYVMYDKSKASISVTYDTLKVKNDKEIQALSMLKGESLRKVSQAKG